MKSALEIAKESLESIMNHSSDVGSKLAAREALRLIKEAEAKETK